MIKDFVAHYSQELFYTVEIEDWQQTLRKMQFGFQKSWSILVGLHM
jgi:hypothetical protein